MAEQPTVSRRAILRGAVLVGAAGVVLRLQGEQSSPWWDGQPAGGAPLLQLRTTPTFTKLVYRREDQLAVRLEFYNLRLLKQGQAGPGDVQQARLVTVDPTAPAYIVADLGPQHLAEHAYDVVTNEMVSVPTKSMLAGSSRLAFVAPATPIPYLFENVMAWDNLEASLVPHAVKNATVRAPLPTETAVELPWKVVLSPGPDARWRQPLTVDLGPTERALLWHARLAPASGPASGPTTARVVWTPDLDNNSFTDPEVPGVTSLKPGERRDLVRLTAQWDQKSGPDAYVPTPVDVAELALSPLGGWLNATGTWDTRPDGVNLKQWVHRATAGRDQFVRTVEAGRVYPLGHRVELVKLTQRVMEFAPNGKFEAVLRQQRFIVPRERVKTFKDGDVPYAPNGLRDTPFKKIRILTPVTPNLAPYENNPEPGTNVPPANAYPPGTAFWPRVGAPGNWTDFLWDIEAEDFDGRVSRFALPLIYVTESYGTSQALGNLTTYYENTAAPARRTADLGGQRVALAAFAGGESGETAYPLASVLFGANAFIAGPHAEVTPWDFTPRMLSASARLDAVDRIKGGAAGTPQPITLHPQWISKGDSAAVNPGRVFAVLGAPVDLAFAANASGGVATPSMKISALSATTGPIDAPSVGTTAPTTFKPGDFFKGGSPMIFGTIPLTKILQDVAFPASPGQGKPPVPRLVKTDIIEGQAVAGFRTALAWDTDVVSIPGLFVNGIPDGQAARLTLAATADSYVDGRPPSTTISGELTNFTVQAVGELHVIDVMFNRFGFESKDGHKPDMKVSIHDVAFVGALEFVNVLRQYMGGDGLGGGQSPAAMAAAPAPAKPAVKTLQNVDPPGGSGPANGGYVNVSADGVQVGYNLTLPPVPAGALLLENISFGARADLFFDGRPMRMRFNFAERDRPFVLTVMCFGGGGAMAITFGLDAFELFEMTLEFGAKLALDIGVASGSISAMAGIYMAIGDTDGDGNDDGVRLTGFLRLNGELDVLGIVSMSVEFYLAFTYISDPKSVYGEAKVTVEVDVLFFSGSVTLGPIKKTFAGGEGGSPNGFASMTTAMAAKALPSKVLPPVPDVPATFAAMTPPPQWAEYTNLFASAAF